MGDICQSLLTNIQKVCRPSSLITCFFLYQILALLFDRTSNMTNIHNALKILIIFAKGSSNT